LDTQDLETDNSYQDDTSLLMMLPLLNVNKIRLYNDAEEATAVISVEGGVNRTRGEVVDNGQEHFRSWVITHIKDSLRQDFFNEYEGSWTTL
jgi:hypothetical protein